jgi:hypothetical protein
MSVALGGVLCAYGRAAIFFGAGLSLTITGVKQRQDGCTMDILTLAVGLSSELQDFRHHLHVSERLGCLMNFAKWPRQVVLLLVFSS